MRPARRQIPQPVQDEACIPEPPPSPQASEPLTPKLEPPAQLLELLQERVARVLEETVVAHQASVFKELALLRAERQRLEAKVRLLNGGTGPCALNSELVAEAGTQPQSAVKKHARFLSPASPAGEVIAVASVASTQGVAVTRMSTDSLMEQASMRPIISKSKSMKKNVKALRRQLNTSLHDHDWSQRASLRNSLNAAKELFGGQDAGLGDENEPTLFRLHVLELVLCMATIATAVLAGLQTEFPEQDRYAFANACLLPVFWIDICYKMGVLGIKAFFYGSTMYSDLQSKLWNRFDFFITSCATAEVIIDVLDSALLGDSDRPSWLDRVLNFNPMAFRLIRIFRVASFGRLEFNKDLSAMMFGLAYGFRPLCWGLAILLYASYSCGLIMHQLVGSQSDEASVISSPGSNVTSGYSDVNETEAFLENSAYFGRLYFGNVRLATFNVFRCFYGDCTDDQGRPLVLLVGEGQGWLAKFAYTLVTLFITLGLANTIIAMFNERILEGAKFDEEMRTRLNRKEEQFKAKMYKHMLFIYEFTKNYYEDHPEEDAAVSFDENGVERYHVSLGCFRDLVAQKSFHTVVDRMGVRLTDFNVSPDDLFIILSPTGEPLSVEDLLEEISSLRGEARVTLQMLQICIQLKLLRRANHILEVLGVVPMNKHSTAEELTLGGAEY